MADPKSYNPEMPTDGPEISAFTFSVLEWMGEDYLPTVVRHALEARSRVSNGAKQALDTAIRRSALRVPNFRSQAAHRAPAPQLQTPVLLNLPYSNELSGALLQVWVEAQPEARQAVRQRLQEQGVPTDTIDFRGRYFLDDWNADDWRQERDAIVQEHGHLDPNDVGLMLWCVSGKISFPVGNIVRNAGMMPEGADTVDFAHWRGLLSALPPDSPQWNMADDFAAELGKIIGLKKEARTRAQVNVLRASLNQIKERYAEELEYLERDLEQWPVPVILDAKLQDLLQQLFAQIESRFAEYRPIREQASNRGEERRRAARRTELEGEIIDSLNGMEKLLNEVPPLGEEFAESAETETAAAAETAEPAAAAAGDTEPATTAIPAEQLAELEANLQGLREEVELLKEELHSSKTNEEFWRLAYVEAAKLSGTDPTVAGRGPQNVSEAVAWAEERFPSELLFHLNTSSWTKNNPFEDPNSVLEALEWLATTYFRSRTGEISQPNLDESLYQVCRWHYVSNQSEVTIGQYERWYRTSVNGVSYNLSEHMGRGSSKDPTNTIRVAFNWDRDSRKVIVGYIGQHQQTDAT